MYIYIYTYTCIYIYMRRERIYSASDIVIHNRCTYSVWSSWMLWPRCKQPTLSPSPKAAAVAEVPAAEAAPLAQLVSGFMGSISQNDIRWHEIWIPLVLWSWDVLGFLIWFHGTSIRILLWWYITNYIQNWVVYSNTELNTNLRGGFDVEKLTIGQPPISPKVWM